MTNKFLAAATALALGTAGAADAATLVVDANGMLTGATGVTVGNDTYDVQFKEGSCADIYGTCSVDAFDFKTASSAGDAAKALLDQVFLDGPQGQFDTHPELTRGCVSASRCYAFVAYETGVQYYLVRQAINSSPGSIAGVGTSEVKYGYDTTYSESSTFARFALVTSGSGSGGPAAAAVPEPASWALMIAGFGLVGGAMRRRSARVAFA